MNNHEESCCCTLCLEYRLMARLPRPDECSYCQRHGTRLHLFCADPNCHCKTCLKAHAALVDDGTDDDDWD